MKRTLILTLLIAILIIPIIGHAKNNSAKTILKKTSKKISLVCEKSCSKFPITFSRAWSKVNQILNKVETAFKMPVPIKLPIEVRVGFDSACAAVSPELVSANIAKGFTFYKPNGGAMICINGSAKEMASGRVPLAHELTHLYFNTTRDTEEAVKLEETLVQMTTPCTINCIKAKGPKSVCAVAVPDTEFCKDYDLEYTKIPLFIKRLADIRKNGQVTMEDLKETLKYVATH